MEVLHLRVPWVKGWVLIWVLAIIIHFLLNIIGCHYYQSSLVFKYFDIFNWNVSKFKIISKNQTVHNLKLKSPIIRPIQWLTSNSNLWQMQSYRWSCNTDRLSSRCYNKHKWITCSKVMPIHQVLQLGCSQINNLDGFPCRICQIHHKIWTR